MIEVTAGIDIGGTNSVVGLVSRKGKVLMQATVSTVKYSKAKEFVKALDNKIRELFQNMTGEYILKGIGVGAPNTNYYKGTIENAPNLPWKGIIPFRDLFLEHRNIPFALTNDANAAAVGEMIYGGAGKMKNFIVLTLGTGLGSGIIVNGEVVYGHSGFAGEMGHMIMEPGGRECGCGRQGCLETYVSATGICSTVLELLALRKGKSSLRKYKFEEISSKIIATAAADGDPIALEAFDKTAYTLSIAIVNALAFSSPEAIFLFGGLSRAGDLLMQPLKKWVDKHVQIFFRDTFSILFSSLEESNAAVLGASALAWKELDYDKQVTPE